MQLSDWMAREGHDDERLGSLLGVDRATVNRLRRGVTKPSWDLAGRIKSLSGGAVTPDDFLPMAEQVPS